MLLFFRISAIVCIIKSIPYLLWKKLREMLSSILLYLIFFLKVDCLYFCRLCWLSQAVLNSKSPVIITFPPLKVLRFCILNGQKVQFVPPGTTDIPSEKKCLNSSLPTRNIKFKAFACGRFLSF